MNLGQYLTQYSPLPSGTVAQHLAAIAGRIGTGAGQTIFCSQFSVRIEQQEAVVTRKTRRRVAPEPAAVARAPVTDKQQKQITAFHAAQRLSAFYETDEITVQQRTASVVASHKLDNRVIRMKGGA